MGKTVIPLNMTVTIQSATKVGSYWSSGNIDVLKVGRVCQIKFNAVVLPAISARTTIASIPLNYAPITETGGNFDGETTYFFIEPNGEIRVNALPAGTRWGSTTYITSGQL